MVFRNILITILCLNTRVSSFLQKADHSAAISLSICEVIANFYSKYSKNVDIIDYGSFQSDIVSKIMENLNNSMAVTLHKPQNIGEWTKKLESQSILLFDSFMELKHFTSRDLIKIRYLNPIRILVYCKNATFVDISKLDTTQLISSYYYFIIVDKNGSNFELFTFDNRDDLKVCHENQRLIKINELSVKNLKWINNPLFPKKYKNFYGCTMFIGTTISTNFFRYDSVQNKIDGMIVSLMIEISNRLNFEVYYALCFNGPCRDPTKSQYHIYNVIAVAALDAYAISEGDDFDWQNPMLNIQCTPQLYVPPGDLYTSVEKMKLPFDKETWIGIILTFISAASAIVLINRLAKNIKILFYGTAVHTPILNVIRAFFGDGQTNLPHGNFARLILISFIFWCLVMRTAYQGKLFEFTTTAIRKPAIMSLEELKIKNFTLYVSEGRRDYGVDDFIVKTVGLNAKFLSNEEYSDIYLSNISDSSFTGTVLTCDLEHELNIHFMKFPMERRFVSLLFSKSYYGLAFLYPNLWNERLHEILEGLVTGGIVNGLMNRYTKSKWNLMSDQIRSEKVVLNLSHLGFGFQICFYVLYVSFLTFLGELAINFIFKKPRSGNEVKARQIELLKTRVGTILECTSAVRSNSSRLSNGVSSNNSNLIEINTISDGLENSSQQHFGSQISLNLLSNLDEDLMCGKSLYSLEKLSNQIGLLLGDEVQQNVDILSDMLINIDNLKITNENE